jgi:RimJ/RimL family protein N-acetyltransferase
VPGVAEFELTSPLETERLVLRPYTNGDFDALYAMRSTPEVVRYLYWEAQTADEVRETLAKKIASMSIRSEGDVLALAVEDRSTGTLVGDVILHWLSQAHSVAEIGYIVLPDHAGRGYATEAARAVLSVAFDQLGLHRVIASVEARNVGSARVLEKLGMRKEAHFVENEFVKNEWQSELVYAILDREWRSSPRGTRPPTPSHGSIGSQPSR